jgi:hypothetical protein
VNHLLAQISHVQQSVDALSAAGPWVAWVLTAGVCAWLHVELKTEKHHCRSRIEGLEKAIGELQERRVAGMAKDAATLLGLAHAMGERDAQLAVSLEGLREKLSELIDEMRRR